MNLSDCLLHIKDLQVRYGAAQALFGLDLSVAKGETVALVGANGAGKTSLLKAVMGVVPVTGGAIYLDGQEVTGSTPAAMAARGVALCPEGREMFGDLTVRENLNLGALALKISRGERERRLEGVLERFPRLREKSSEPTATLSGGGRAADGGHRRPSWPGRASCSWTNPAWGSLPKWPTKSSTSSTSWPGSGLPSSWWSKTPPGP